jgi:4,5-dihydroxyphthalate decarboxylase
MTAAPDFVVRGGDYEHVVDFAGTYQGMALGYEAMPTRGIFMAMLASRPYETSEFSLANLITLHAAGDRRLRALPVFPYRAFRHSFVYTRRDGPLTSFSEFRGKRIGIEDYSMTAAVWLRGLIEDDYGVDHREITWVMPRSQRFPPPARANVDFVDGDLETLVEEGKVDAFLGLSARDAARPQAERKLKTVLPDPEAAERDYFQRTGVFPINHCVVVREDVLAANPALPQAVCEAYASAKASAYKRKLGATLLPWTKERWSRTFELFGGDPLPYGLTPLNRKVVEMLARYLHTQGLIEKMPETDTLFVPSTVG